MSTDFLNRRMDLLHECRNFGFIDEFGTVIDVNGDNYLTMDTSYPVRLAGKVIKLFTAVSDYNRQKFIIRNSNKDTILEVNVDNIYDFAGRVINNNIGEEQAYESVKVYAPNPSWITNKK